MKLPSDLKQNPNAWRWMVSSVLMTCFCSLVPTLAHAKKGDINTQQANTPPVAKAPPQKVLARKTPTFNATLKQTPKIPAPLKVGQPFTLTVEVTHPEGAKVIAPESAPSKWWSILSSKTTSGSGERATTTTVTLEMVAWRPGSRTVGPLTVNVQNAKGEVIALKTTAVDIKPLSTLPTTKDGQDFKAAQRPVDIMVEDKSPLWIGLSLLSIVLTGMFVFFLMRRRIQAIEPEVVERLPHVIALERLSQLAASTLIEDRKYLTFYSEMSEAIRDFMGRQFGFPGTELTTTEIEQMLDKEDWPNALSVKDVCDWLREGDRIKFTEAEPTTNDAEAALRKAFTIVELTRHHQDILAEQAAQEAARQADEAQGALNKVRVKTPQKQGAVTKLKPSEPETPSTIEAPSEGFDKWAAIVADASSDDTSDAQSDNLQRESQGDISDGKIDAPETETGAPIKLIESIATAASPEDVVDLHDEKEDKEPNEKKEGNEAPSMSADAAATEVTSAPVQASDAELPLPPTLHDEERRDD